MVLASPELPREKPKPDLLNCDDILTLASTRTFARQVTNGKPMQTYLEAD